MIIYLVSGITFQVSLAARNGSTRRESCAEIDSIIDEEDDDGTLCCHGWHLDIDLFICVRTVGDLTRSDFMFLSQLGAGKHI